MSRHILRGGRIFDPGAGVDRTADLAIDGGRIAEIGLGLSGDSERDCAGLLVTPAFVDLHSHLRDPGLTHKESIATGARAAAAGGFGTVCCMPNTDPVIDTKSVVDYVIATARSAAGARVLPIGAVTKGQQGKELAELVELAEAGAVAFSDDGNPVTDSSIMRKAMEYATITGRPVIDHCEDKALTRGAPMNEGPVATRLGLRGWPWSAEAIMVARDVLLAEELGAAVHIAHVSTSASVRIIRDAKARGVRVTAEATPHHLTMTDRWVLGDGLHWPACCGSPITVRAPYDTRTKVNPPLRSQADVAALVEGLNDGTIDCIATDHAPHAVVDKLVEYDRAAFGISGFETAFASLYSLVLTGQCELATIIRALTAAPVAVLALPRANGDVVAGPAGPCSSGTLHVGALADIAVLDLHADWNVEPEKMLSKGKNTPLDGVGLRGRAVATYVGGRVVHSG